MRHSVPGANLGIDQVFVLGEIPVGRKIEIARCGEVAHHAVRSDSSFVEARLRFPALGNIVQISPRIRNRRSAVQSVQKRLTAGDGPCIRTV